MSHLVTVMGGVSELYVRQLGISLTITSISLYTTPDDPWNAPNPHSGATADVLCEFSSYWQAHRPVKTYPRNGAMFFTGKRSRDIGGQAWLSSLCNYSAKPASCPYGGYGIVVIIGAEGHHRHRPRAGPHRRVPAHALLRPAHRYVRRWRAGVLFRSGDRPRPTAAR